MFRHIHESILLTHLHKWCISKPNSYCMLAFFSFSQLKVQRLHRHISGRWGCASRLARWDTRGQSIDRFRQPIGCKCCVVGECTERWLASTRESPERLVQGKFYSVQEFYVLRGQIQIALVPFVGLQRKTQSLKVKGNLVMSVKRRLFNQEFLKCVLSVLLPSTKVILIIALHSYY